MVALGSGGREQEPPIRAGKLRTSRPARHDFFFPVPASAVSSLS
jgi:hypothetical protein